MPPLNSGGKQMKYQKLTPNLVVHDVAASVNFYCTVLGFRLGMKVPDMPPYVFASVVEGDIEIFFNDHKAVEADYPALVSRPLGGTMTLYVEVEGLEEVLRAVEKAGARITMPLKTQFYGIREFAFEDPDGWVITIAERVK
jgi:uncharacterized glyoxalase superfamily protein PhnB